LRFYVLTAASIQMAAFWDVAQCSPVEVVSEVCTASIVAVMIEAVRNSKTLVCLHETCTVLHPRKLTSSTLDFVSENKEM
jgi:hypothetical protein